MIARSARFIAAFACAAFYTTIADAQLGKPTEGRPVAANDLVGKKICWDNGNVGSYLAGGKYSSTMAGTGTWRATAVGIELHAEHYSGYQDVDKRPDGTFYSGLEHGAGHYCK